MLTICSGTAFKDIKSDRLYPSVGMKKPGEHLRVNFGQMPFVYDIDGMVEVQLLPSSRFCICLERIEERCKIFVVTMERWTHS